MLRVRTCRVPSAKLLAVFVQPSGPTRSCQGRDEKSTSRVRSGIRLPSLQRRRDRDHMDSWLSGYLQATPLTNSFTQIVVINDRFDMLAL